MKTITLEIVTRVMTTFGHCRHCDVLFSEAGLGEKLHQAENGNYPPDMRQEFTDLSNWIRELLRLYRHRLRIRLIDAQSFLGLYKSLRHWIRRYPAFIVEGKEKYSGWDKAQLELLIDKHMAASLRSTS